MAKVGRRRRTHGQTFSSTYRSWQHMHKRCASHPDYAGRGIVVCTQWGSFAVFLRDMGERPRGTSLDRIDNDGNYEPSNCRWATQIEQANNRRTNVRVELNGETRTIKEWARHLHISYDLLRARLKKGVPMVRAITPGRLKQVEKTAGEL